MLGTRWPNVLRTIAVLAATGGGACAGDGPAAPPPVATIEVTSPLGALWDVGAGVQLAAAATDARGSPTSGTTFEWSSSNPAVADVDDDGRVSTLAAGPVTIRARADGVLGALPAQVVDADGAAISALVADPYVEALVGALSSSVLGRLQAALDDCGAGVASGDLARVELCIAAVLAESGVANDPNDRALLAVLGVVAVRIEALLYM
jgi:hypothetical protein